jgi:hypothetical protein
VERLAREGHVKKLLIGIGIGLVIGTATAATATTMGEASLASAASATPTERTPSGDIVFDKCPRASALLYRSEVLEDALAALWRKLPVVFYNVTWAQGKHGPINHATAAVGEAVQTRPGSGDAGKFYRAATPFCGSTVARNTWAFRVGFANAPNALAAGHVAFIVRAKDGWHLYGAVPSYRVG